MGNIPTVSTFFKEDNGGRARAEVVYDGTTYSIRYYDVNGNYHRTESYAGKNLHFVEDAAQNWVDGIKVLTE